MKKLYHDEDQSEPLDEKGDVSITSHSSQHQISHQNKKIFYLSCTIITLALIGLILFVNYQSSKIQSLRIDNIKLKQQLQTQNKVIDDLSLNLKNKIGKVDKAIEDLSTKMIQQLQQKTEIINNNIYQTKKIKQKVNNFQFQKVQKNAKKINTKKNVKSAPIKYNISKLQNPNRVVQVIYSPGQIANLPLNTLQTNKEGKKVEDYLYPDEEMRIKRVQFQQQRKKFIKLKSRVKQFFLIQFNNPLDEETQSRGKKENQKQWLRLEDKFSLSQITTELPICIIVTGYNNNEKFRIEHNLNSIFMQNYSNYKVIIIDDASTDGSLQVYKKYLDFYKINQKYYTLISNAKKVTALPNHYFGTMYQCRKDSIALHVDGDDELIGSNVLKVFNWAYQTKKAGVVYSNFYWYLQPTNLKYGYTSQYSQLVKKNNLYREKPMKFSHLRSYRVQLLHQVDANDFLDTNGNFFTIAYDIALMLPLLQLSCGRVNKIDDQYHYLYNIGTGLNDYKNKSRQLDAQDQIRMTKKKYQCWKQFDNRMKI